MKAEGRREEIKLMQITVSMSNERIQNCEHRPSTSSDVNSL